MWRCVWKCERRNTTATCRSVRRMRHYGYVSGREREGERERGREGERACHSTPHGFCGSPEASVVHWGLKRSNHTERVCECACQSRRPLAVLSVCITIFLCACTQVEANQALLVYFQTFETHNNYLFRDPHSTHFFKESLTILISC